MKNCCQKIRKIILQTLLFALTFLGLHDFSAMAQAVIITPSPGGADSEAFFMRRGVNPRFYQLPPAHDLLDDRFDEIDLNRDNILSRAEQEIFLNNIATETRTQSGTDLLATRQKLRLRHHYHQADRNHDNVLTRAELEDYLHNSPYISGNANSILYPLYDSGR